MATTLEEATKEANRLKQYYPYRIIWIKQESPKLFEVYADKTRHRQSRAVRNGFKVWELEGRKNT